MSDKQTGDRSALKQAEAIIAAWDRDGGFTYRELALQIGAVFGVKLGGCPVEEVDQPPGTRKSGR